ncbi:MAG: carboxypeptidase regulatory-like domain-containing protein [Candidatus Eisenbacteria bacterium]|nr:carboxypeptidase regulatory-like domain-containing protein [Candidatus Eisenbacteria bacterium]
MRKERRLMQLVVVVSMVGILAGCSSMGADDSWTGNTGSVTGTVVSDKGTTLPDIEVCLWCESDNESREVEYEVQTCDQGTFSFTDLDLGTVHSFARTYEIYVNCTKSSATAVDSDYRTWTSTITVGADQTCTVDVVLNKVPDVPGDPSQYVGE